MDKLLLMFKKVFMVWLVLGVINIKYLFVMFLLVVLWWGLVLRL